MSILKETEKTLSEAIKVQKELIIQGDKAFKYISIVKRRFPLIHDEILREVNCEGN